MKKLPRMVSISFLESMSSSYHEQRCWVLGFPDPAGLACPSFPAISQHIRKQRPFQPGALGSLTSDK